MNSNEYTIHIFGQDIQSQDGLFRLDEIRRIGIQIGKVADGRSTEVTRFMRTNVGRHLINPKNGFIKKIDMGRLGTSWLTTPEAAIEFGRWLDFEYGLEVTKAFVAMTSSASVQAAVAADDSIDTNAQDFISRHAVKHYSKGELVSEEVYEERRVGRCDFSQLKRRSLQS
ncbi:hypothetical protein SMKC082_19170 [Serratia marcescens]|nr:hypothetical protein SMKC082_19170 [Serratia marcescens]